MSEYRSLLSSGSRIPLPREPQVRSHHSAPTPAIPRHPRRNKLPIHTHHVLRTLCIHIIQHRVLRDAFDTHHALLAVPVVLGAGPAPAVEKEPYPRAVAEEVLAGHDAQAPGHGALDAGGAGAEVGVVVLRV
jgi:hypothetical protein